MYNDWSNVAKFCWKTVRGQDPSNCMKAMYVMLENHHQNDTAQWHQPISSPAVNQSGSSDKIIQNRHSQTAHYSAHYRAPYYSNISKYHTSDSEHPSPSSRSCGSLESLLRGQPHAPLPCHQWIQWIRKQIRNDYSILLRPLHTPIPPLSASSSKQRHKQRAQAIALPNVHSVSEGNFEWFCWHQSLCALTSAAKVRCELQM